MNKFEPNATSCILCKPNHSGLVLATHAANPRTVQNLVAYSWRQASPSFARADGNVSSWGITGALPLTSRRFVGSQMLKCSSSWKWSRFLHYSGQSRPMVGHGLYLRIFLSKILYGGGRSKYVGRTSEESCPYVRLFLSKISLTVDLTHSETNFISRPLENHW